MNIKWKIGIASVTLLIALAIFLFWYMSPYEQCVRAETAINSERLIELQNKQETLPPGEYKSDQEIWNEQKRLAVLNCAHISN